MGTLSAVYKFAMNLSRKWANANPCEGVELPEVPKDVEIHYLQLDQVQALIDHAQPGPYEAIDRAMYRTAAMTGMRDGKLIALRWSDVVMTAAAPPPSKIRVRRSHVLGEFGTPKSKCSSRGVPMADQVAVNWSAATRRAANPPITCSCSRTRTRASHCTRLACCVGTARRSRRRSST